MKIIPTHKERLLRIIFFACVTTMLVATGLFAQTTIQAPDPAMTRQLHQAVKLAEQGDKQGAMTIALHLLERNPKFAAAIKLKGTLLEDAGKTSEAAAAYEEALTLTPNDPDLVLKTGIYELNIGNTDESIKLLEHCVKITPADGDAHYYLAQAYHLKGQDQLALSAIRRSLKVDPNNPSVWQKYGELLCGTGDCEGGLRWLLKAQRSDATLPRLDYDIAVADYKMMDLPAAAQFAARAAKAQPNDREALKLLATANAKLARWQEAEAAFQQLQNLKSDDVETLLGLGQCELELKKYDAAIATLQSALRLDPTRFLAHFYLSRAFAALGRTADAEHEAALHQLMMGHATFVRSLESDQREEPIKADARRLLAAHHEAEAVRLYQGHFKGTSANIADAYVFVGKLYLFMGQTDDGLRCLHHALKIQPTVRGAHTYEGILALKLGDLSRAENEFTAELANDPNYQLAIAELGEVRYHQARWSDAAEQVSKSKTMTPELLYMLCDSYFRLGKVADANLNAEAAAAYSQNKPEVMRGLSELLVKNGQADLAKRLATNSQ